MSFINAILSSISYVLDSINILLNIKNKKQKNNNKVRKQAESVSAWFEKNDLGPKMYFAKVNNNSNKYIFNVKVYEFEHPNDELKTFPKILPKTCETSDPIIIPTLRLDAPAIITFKDSKGNIWKRDEYGDLTDITEKVTENN
ncbi:hypothetical protein [Fructilactobacillus cliffordii]|uniref:Uncharacterized protein n=1 Tax=Fructilactobacillus cliffordii TaxID=2940299 RepID=A0A9Q8ZUY7_9LACO|nr:hypothetical protein [Fructilactobacillus cliffordii]USS89880.1 hypothetical protein M3M40_03675 [Fructilactobacillus cliffordii]